ncbi:MAG: hypothetical protein ABI995_17310, partial [Acidobacteriota bacterium]
IQIETEAFTGAVKGKAGIAVREGSYLLVDVRLGMIVADEADPVAVGLARMDWNWRSKRSSRGLWVARQMAING